MLIFYQNKLDITTKKLLLAFKYKNMKKQKYLFLGITFLLSFGLALFVAMSVFPNNPFSSKAKTENKAMSKIQDGDIIF